MSAKFSVFGIVVSLVMAGLIYLASSQWSANRKDSDWYVLTEGTFIHEPSFSDLFFFDKHNGIVLSGSTIDRSSDGGKNWEEVPIRGVQGFYSIAVQGRQNVWIVGSDQNDRPLIMKTNDKGGSWHKVPFDENSLSKIGGMFTSFSKICFDRSGKSWIIGNSDVVEAWTDETSRTKGWRRRQVGNRGIVQAVFDGQTLRASSVFFTKERLLSLSCSELGDVWAVGEEGAVFHYENAWIKKEMDKKYVFTRTLSLGNDVWIVGGVEAASVPGRGVVLRSRDKGRSWENKTPESATVMFDIFLKDGKGWLIGAEGRIYHSEDGGDSWIRYESPTRNDLKKMFMLNSENGWICGGRATVLRYRLTNSKRAPNRCL